MADEAGSWNDLHARFQVERINHEQAYSPDGGIYTIDAKGYFRRRRRGEIGIHHHIAGRYLVRHAQKALGARISAGSIMGGRPRPSRASRWRATRTLTGAATDSEPRTKPGATPGALSKPFSLMRCASGLPRPSPRRPSSWRHATARPWSPANVPASA